MAMTGLGDITDTFDLLDSWEDRYRYIIDLGRELELLPEQARKPQNKVRGCSSQVWMVASLSDSLPRRLHFIGDSDAHIVKGLIAILFAIYNDKMPEEIVSIDGKAILDQLGLSTHLSPTRSNGLFAMLGRIGDLARENSIAGTAADT